MVANARKTEADEINAAPFAQELEKMRVIGEAGQKVMQGESTNYAFGQNPAELLLSMFKAPEKK